MGKPPIPYGLAKIIVSIPFCAVFLQAQTYDEFAFQAVMLPGNVVPAIASSSLSATGTIGLELVRNSAGQVISGTVEYYMTIRNTGPATFTEAHIHRGAPGTNGPVAATARPANPDRTGDTTLVLRNHVPETDQAGLDMLAGLLEDPAMYYLDLHTSALPEGAIRGQFRPTEGFLQFLAPMNATSQVPPIAGSNAFGVVRVTIAAARDASGAIASALMSLGQLGYNFPEQVTFTGLHIHRGVAGESGAITIARPPFPQPASAANGIGSLPATLLDPLNTAAGLETVTGLLNNPGNYYIDLHTTASPDGAMRGQVRKATYTFFPVTMLPSNVIPPVTSVSATGVGQIQVFTLRAENGSAEAAWIFPIAAIRFAGRTELTGFHMHAGAAGANGPLAIGFAGGTPAAPVVTETGFDTIFAEPPPFLSGSPALASINSLLQNPQNFFIDLHTTDAPPGALRAQMAAASAAAPAVASGGVFSAVSDKSRTTLAPLELFTILGTNLAKVTTGLGTGNPVPESLDGITVDIGGKRARILYASPNQIQAQIPADVPTGQQQLIVNNGSALSAAVSVTVASAAPAIFFNSAGGAVLKNANFSQVVPGNETVAGEVLVIYFTGGGQTDPPLGSGAIAGFPPLAVTAPVRVTIGGQAAEVFYSAASPGFAGLYQAAVRMPPGVLPGNAPVVLSIGGANSNTVTIAVR